MVSKQRVKHGAPRLVCVHHGSLRLTAGDLCLDSNILWANVCVCSISLINFKTCVLNIFSSLFFFF